MKKYLLISLLFIFNALVLKAQTDITGLAGGILTCQYNDSPSAEGISNLTDNSATTKFLTFHPSAWVQFKSALPYILSKYTITSGNDSPERDPVKWELTGSNNGVTFYPLDSRTSQVFSSRTQKREFLISNNRTSYIYYRLAMTSTSGNILQVSELELLGTEGTLSTETFADFSVNPALYSGTPSIFTNASLNATSYSWTFEGGNPSTSNELNPKVIFNTPGTYTVTLVAYNGNVTSTKTISVVVKDMNDWSSFIYPTVTLECANTSNAGYIKYQKLAALKGFNSIESFVKNCCLVIAKQLYYTVDEANLHNLRSITYKLTEGGSLSYKGGSVPDIEIGFDMNYLNTFSQNYSDAVSADEIDGVLCHEICHGYQNEPKNAGVYGTPSENYGFIEGTADLARLLTGGFNPPRHPSKGGSWLDAYNTTAFFYYWITNTKSVTFLKDLNKTALTIDPWTLNAATQQLFGLTAQSLWNQYQTALSTSDVNQEKSNLIIIVQNQSKTELYLKNLYNKSSVGIYDLNGRELIKLKTVNTTETIDISKLTNGIYIIKIVEAGKALTIKFIK